MEDLRKLVEAWADAEDALVKEADHLDRLYRLKDDICLRSAVTEASERLERLDEARAALRAAVGRTR